MTKDEALQILDRLDASGDKAIVHFDIEAQAVRAIDGEGKPVDPKWAMAAIEACHNTAADLGLRSSFSVARFEG